MTHADAAAIAAQTPRTAAPGSGGLPRPRTALEAGFFVAIARQDGAHTHTLACLHFCILAQTHSSFVFFRCILILGGLSRLERARHHHALVHNGRHQPRLQKGRIPLYPRVLVDLVDQLQDVCQAGAVRVSRLYTCRLLLEYSSRLFVCPFVMCALSRCSAKLADGILTVAAAAAPPPPPGATTRGYYDPQKAPPPPPSVKSRALSIYQRETIYSLTEAVCSGRIGEGAAHRSLCQAFLDKIDKFVYVPGAGSVSPLCMDLCWDGCDTTKTGGQVDDSFENCPRIDCAKSKCHNFLLAECPPVMHATINTAFKETCTIVPPR
jgi:hypothetical protein